MSRDLIERTSAEIATSIVDQLWLSTHEKAKARKLIAAALEAEASEGERRGLERAAEVASRMYVRDAFRFEFGNDVAAAIRALIPEAPAREGNPEDDPRYPALLAEAEARGRNENLDGSPRRHALPSPPQDREEQ